VFCAFTFLLFAMLKSLCSLRKFSDRYSSNDAALAEGHSHHGDHEGHEGFGYFLLINFVNFVVMLDFSCLVTALPR
jgi:hypothetical protein